jgi:hypothetical protein
MPAIVYQSPAMASARLALVAQSFVEQSNGLVEVSVQYAAIADNASKVLPLFKTDSQPPIHPSLVNLDNLQTRRLYLRDFNSTLANGMLEINTVYVGASYIALQSPALFSDIESLLLRINIAATDTFVVTTTPGFFGSVSGQGFTQFDFYEIECTFRTEEQQTAVIATQENTLGQPPLLDVGTRSGLIMGAAFVSRVIGTGPSGGTVTALRGFRYRSMSALEIVNALAETQSNGMAGFTVEKTRKVEFQTPTVKLLSEIYNVELDPDALSPAFGFNLTTA